MNNAITVRILPNDSSSPVGKLADAELLFGAEAGPLAGLKLIGFSVWEARNGRQRNVTFPARTFSVNGERRSFALLRPVTDSASQDAIRALILAALAAYELEASGSNDTAIVGERATA